VVSPIPDADGFVLKNGLKIWSRHGIIGSGISDRKNGVSAWLQFCFSETDFVPRYKGGSSNGQLSSAGHGVARIDDEIQQDLPDLAAVGSNRTEI
jgi:hypothetical protein